MYIFYATSCVFSVHCYCCCLVQLPTHHLFAKETLHKFITLKKFAKHPTIRWGLCNMLIFSSRVFALVVCYKMSEYISAVRNRFTVCDAFDLYICTEHFIAVCISFIIRLAVYARIAEPSSMTQCPRLRTQYPGAKACDLTITTKSNRTLNKST